MQQYQYLGQSTHSRPLVISSFPLACQLLSNCSLVYGICWVIIKLAIEYCSGQQEQMQCGSISAVEAVNPLIKIVKQREDLYFELLSFVNKNIQSSSNDLDTLTIFNKFLAEINLKHDNIKAKQNQFLLSFDDAFTESNTSSDDPKQLLRLSSRLIEILQASITKVRKSVFEDSGRSVKEFNRFKIMLNKILKRQAFIVKDYVEYIINYCVNKYQKQINKINKYVYKVQQGENIWFKELYNKQASDVQISPEKNKNEERGEAKTERKIDMTEHLSSTEQHEKKAVSLKKGNKSSTKRRERLLNIKNTKQKQQEQSSMQQSISKQQTASKLLKFYSLLELNKKQFLQDYVYDKLQEEKHRAELMSKLMERNKDINKQINGFVKKSSTYIPTYLAPPSASLNKSSGDERNQSASSKISLRTSFIISKRKSSFHIESSSDSDKKKEDKGRELQVFQKTIKNINPRRRSSHSNRPQDKSKKLFVVKAPMVFEEEIIPQAQMVQTQWFQQPLSSKTRQKRNENIRLKRKNNPNPLQNTFFPQNFRYPL